MTGRAIYARSYPSFVIVLTASFTLLPDIELNVDSRMYPTLLPTPSPTPTPSPPSAAATAAAAGAHSLDRTGTSVYFCRVTLTVLVAELTTPPE